ncbi:MAG: flavodoxin family protein [Desulfotomaculum sp.]|nr:flavodoxin family protein [Desulfotomaculum sp.]MCL0080631.1 flavodoxin family protein [Peptococcaceae bacterium]
MLIIALNGSPNKDGNTAFLLNEALETINSTSIKTKFLQISEVLPEAKHPFCTCCSTPCSGICYKGTLLESMYHDLRQADGVILGSPVYFGTVSAQMKSFWDKTRAVRKDKVLIDVVGAAITTGASRFGGQETTARALHDIMLIHGMTVVGDGFYDDDAGHQAACAQKPTSEDEIGIKRTRILAKRIAVVAKATADLRNARS